MIILLSPAKTVDFSKPLIHDTTSTIVFEKESIKLMKLLKKLSKKEIQHTMKLSDDLTAQTHHNIQKWSYPFEKSNSQNAIFAFKGEAYNGFDVTTLTPEHLHTAQERLIILSGLYGALQPLTPIIPYRLEMATKLEGLKDGSLYHFWRPLLTKQINLLLSKKSETILVNLASDEYFKALNIKEVKHKVITPQFLDFSNGQYKVVSVFAKKARGAMARFLCSPQITSAKELIAFTDLGYHYDANRSTEWEPVFVR